MTTLKDDAAGGGRNLRRHGAGPISGLVHGKHQGCWTVVEYLHVQALDGTGSGGEEDSSAAFGFGMTTLKDDAAGGGRNLRRHGAGPISGLVHGKHQGCWTVVEYLHVQALDGTGSGGEEDSSAAFGVGMTRLRDNTQGRR